MRSQMSGSRIKVAGRFKPCLHIGCFDLDTFVEINQRARKVCGLHICTCSSSSRSSDVRIFSGCFSCSSHFFSPCSSTVAALLSYEFNNSIFFQDIQSFGLAGILEFIQW
jgi:hypothetical protein